MLSKVKKAGKFFKGKNTQRLKQPGGNGGREKNTKKRITVYLFVILHGISVQSNLNHVLYHTQNTQKVVPFLLSMLQFGGG